MCVLLFFTSVQKNFRSDKNLTTYASRRSQKREKVLLQDYCQILNNTGKYQQTFQNSPISHNSIQEFPSPYMQTNTITSFENLHKNEFCP